MIDDGDVLVRTRMSSLEKKSCFICLLVYFFLCLLLDEALGPLFELPEACCSQRQRILRRLSAPIICCFSLAIYFLHCFGRLNSPPPTPPLPPLPPSQSHTCFSLTLSFSPSLSFGNLAAFYPWPRKDGESERRLEKTSQDFFRNCPPTTLLPPHPNLSKTVCSLTQTHFDFRRQCARA